MQTLSTLHWLLVRPAAVLLAVVSRPASSVVHATIWRVILGGAKFHESQSQPSELIFVTATQTNKRHCAAVLIVHTPSDRFSMEARSEELTSCCSNSIDAGYSSLLLRCEGEMIHTNRAFSSAISISSARTLGAVVGNTGPLPGLVVEYTISSLAYPTLTDKVGHTRLRHQLTTLVIKWHLSHLLYVCRWILAR